jgi:FtsH-binding integral membrane protein
MGTRRVTRVALQGALYAPFAFTMGYVLGFCTVALAGTWAAPVLWAALLLTGAVCVAGVQQ